MLVNPNAMPSWPASVRCVIWSSAAMASSARKLRRASTSIPVSGILPSWSLGREIATGTFELGRKLPLGKENRGRQRGSRPLTYRGGTACSKDERGMVAQFGNPVKRSGGWNGRLADQAPVKTSIPGRTRIDVEQIPRDPPATFAYSGIVQHIRQLGEGLVHRGEVQRRQDNADAMVLDDGSGSADSR